MCYVYFAVGLMIEINRINEARFEKHPLVLLVLDGFGLADSAAPGNAITPETAPHIFSLMENYPWAELNTTGEAVGLFPGQKGNSEAGHMCLGTGRIVEQDILRISSAIEDGTFFKNEAFKQAVRHRQKHNSAAHVMGLLTAEHSAHAYPEHLYAMLEYLRREGVREVYLHIFTDGRDTPPHQAVELLRELREHMTGDEKVATIMGRFYAMDRAKHWDRTEAAYDAMTLGVAPHQAESAEAAIVRAYNCNLTDEYIEPTVITEGSKPVGVIGDHDIIFFINARSDRARQLTKTFVQSEFTEGNSGAFTRKTSPQNILFVEMTDFGPDLDSVLTAFPSPDVEESIVQVLGIDGRQLYISEAEKYAHVTYFLNGGYAETRGGEKRIKIASEAIESYADKPEMNSPQMTAEIIRQLEMGEKLFICANYPNADMVGHTGDFEAAKRAVAILDGEIQKITRAVLSRLGRLIILADHGNAEEMIDPATGEMMTEHTQNPVPCIIVSEMDQYLVLRPGLLSDVVPTILDLYGIEKPEEMTGRSLINP